MSELSEHLNDIERAFAALRDEKLLAVQREKIITGILRDVLPYVAITHHDDAGTGAYYCNATPSCRPPVTLESCDHERTACYDGNFPHTPECPARRALEAARAAAGVK